MQQSFDFDSDSICEFATWGLYNTLYTNMHQPYGMVRLLYRSFEGCSTQPCGLVCFFKATVALSKLFRKEFFGG